MSKNTLGTKIVYAAEGNKTLESYTGLQENYNMLNRYFTAIKNGKENDIIKLSSGKDISIKNWVMESDNLINIMRTKKKSLEEKMKNESQELQAQFNELNSNINTLFGEIAQRYPDTKVGYAAQGNKTLESYTGLQENYNMLNRYFTAIKNGKENDIITLSSGKDISIKNLVMESDNLVGIIQYKQKSLEEKMKNESQELQAKFNELNSNINTLFEEIAQRYPDTKVGYAAQGNKTLKSYTGLQENYNMLNRYFTAIKNGKENDIIKLSSGKDISIKNWVMESDNLVGIIQYKQKSLEEKMKNESQELQAQFNELNSNINTLFEEIAQRYPDTKVGYAAQGNKTLKSYTGLQENYNMLNHYFSAIKNGKENDIIKLSSGKDISIKNWVMESDNLINIMRTKKKYLEKDMKNESQELQAQFNELNSNIEKLFGEIAQHYSNDINATTKAQNNNTPQNPSPNNNNQTMLVEEVMKKIQNLHTDLSSLKLMDNTRFIQAPTQQNELLSFKNLPLHDNTTPKPLTQNTNNVKNLKSIFEKNNNKSDKQNK